MDKEEAKVAAKDKLDSVVERSKTAEDRLDKYFEQQGPAPEPMPSSNKTEEPTSTDETPAGDEAEDELVLPDNASERTKTQFEKLKQRNAELAKEKADLESRIPKEEEASNGESVFDGFYPREAQTPQAPVEPVGTPQVNAPYLNPLQVQNIAASYVDAEGNVDLVKFNEAIARSNNVAFEAQRRAQSVEEKLARISQKEQEREAYAQYPEIDPQNRAKFDKELFEMTRDRLLRNMYNGKEERLVDVVKSIRTRYNPPVDVQKAKEQAVSEYQQSQSKRNQEPFESGRGEETKTDYEDLRRRTRTKGEIGDKALSERLKALGI